MATIKSFTDLQQSKKLAEILPLESADMHYWRKGQILGVGHSKEMQEGFESKGIDYTPCWSLAALLSVIKSAADYTMQSVNCKESFIVCELGDKPWNITTQYDNEIDACVEMIEKLHELNLL